MRDPLGVRPLVLGKLDNRYILTSETCALDIIGAEFVRDVEPGEIVVIDDKGLHSLKPFSKTPYRFCIFEYIYFARPDSVVEGRSVYDVRKSIGAELARENHVEADLVVPVPDSGVPAAIGYAQQAGTPFELGIIRNHYVGRTFIEPTDQIRHLGVRLKHNANAAGLKDKRVVLFALPGAFTPTCSTSHLPRYEALHDAFKAHGVDDVICLSVNDAFVIYQWGKSQNVDKVRLLPDGNGEFTRKMGMLVEKRNLGFGSRSWRYSMLVNDGEIEKIFVEDGFDDDAPADPFEVSDADTMLAYLKSR